MVHFGFPDNCPLINSYNICFILTVNRVSLEKLPTKTFGYNSWPPANNYTAWLIWILITKALFTWSILEHVLQLIDIRGGKNKKMNTFSCCSPFWVSINRCIKTNDGKKCPLSKSPFPLSFSQGIKDSWLQTTRWDMVNTISIQQTTNNWHKLCHWQYSNSTFSLPSPSPHGCVAAHNVVCILSLLYPLPYVSIIGGLMLSDVWLVPLSPLYLTTLSGPGYNWGSRSLLRSSMSTHHNPTWSPPSQCYQAPSAHHHRQQTSGFCGERGDAATLMTINWLVFALSRRGPLAGVSGVYHV